MAEYGESLAGVREHTPLHQFLVKVPARDAQGVFLPEISAGPKGAPGGRQESADLQFPADFSATIPRIRCRSPSPQATIEAVRTPREALEAGRKPRAKCPRSEFLSIYSHSASQGRHQQQRRLLDRLYRQELGLSGSYVRRARRNLAGARELHAGLFYFLAHDQRVPEPLRRETNSWGLARDEFHRYGNWPRQLYIREPGGWSAIW